MRSPLPQPDGPRSAVPRPITVTLGPDDCALARKYARGAELGGRSQVRGSDRASTLVEDQLVGQLCTLAFHRHVFGQLDLYVASREAANADPWRGDGGTDVPGKHIDVKGSAMRASDEPFRYRLPVRPKERHAGNTYVLALLAREATRVHLVGWARDGDLPEAPDQSGPFSGAFTIPAYALRDMALLRVHEEVDWQLSRRRLRCDACGVKEKHDEHRHLMIEVLECMTCGRYVCKRCLCTQSVGATS